MTMRHCPNTDVTVCPTGSLSVRALGSAWRRLVTVRGTAVTVTRDGQAGVTSLRLPSESPGPRTTSPLLAGTCRRALAAAASEPAELKPPGRRP